MYYMLRKVVWEVSLTETPRKRPPPPETPLDRDPLGSQIGSDIIQRSSPTVNRMTHVSENITLPQMWAVEICTAQMI